MLRFNLRTKLLAIVGLACLGVLSLIATDVILTRQVESELAKLQGAYIPLIELGPRLSSRLEQIGRALQDSVSAGDADALQATRKLEVSLRSEIDLNAKLADPSVDVQRLKSAIEDYYSTAYDVCRRLMSNETGLKVVDAMTIMQRKRQSASTLLKKAFAFDKEKMTQAFISIDNARNVATHIKRANGIICLIFVMLFSLGISRDILRSASLLTSGLGRFGKGEFNDLIPVNSHDEFGEVAEQANRMAIQIQSLMDELKQKSITLEFANRELEAFSYSVAHDLRAPIRAMLGFSNALIEDYSASLPSDAVDMMGRISAAGKRMGLLIDGLLSLSQLSRKDIIKEAVNLSAFATTIVEGLRESDSQRKVTVNIEEGLSANGDARLLQVVLTNLIGNAWKFTSKRSDATVEFRSRTLPDGARAYYVKDNGAGFEMKYSEKLFGTFQRLHKNEEFEGTGIGLATVKRIIHRHGGTIWAEAELDKGATFFFTLA